MSSFTFSKPKIFLLNGPPRSGKDTAGEFLCEAYQDNFPALVKMTDPIKKAVTAIYHDGDRKAFDHYDTPELKDLPQDVYFGKTCREVQIGVSENFLKPFHGNPRIFGEILRNRIAKNFEKNGQQMFFVSDSGFRPEAEALIDEFGAENVFLFRVFREGFNYKLDSRGYITLKDLGVREFDIQNPEENKNAYFGSYISIVDNILNPPII